MTKRTEVKIKCAACGTPLAIVYKGKAVNGVLQHKCSKCGRHWDVDYTNKTIIWVRGKENCTSIKRHELDLATGNTSPTTNENIDKALLRRE